VNSPAVARGGRTRERSIQRLRLAGLAFAGMAGCHAQGTSPASVTAATLDRDIFKPNCAFGSCHGGGAPAAGLDFTNGVCAAMLQRPSCLFPDQTLALPGDPDKSFLVQKLRGNDLPPKPATSCGTSDFRMPLGGTPLAADQIARVAAWIAGGAFCGGDASVLGDDDGQTIGIRVPGDAGLPDGGPEAAPPQDQTLSLVPGELRLGAGERATVMVLISPPAGPDGTTIIVDTSDRDALAVPAAVFAPAGAAQVPFDVIGRQPASAQQLTATLGTASARAAVDITGLYIGEVFYGGGPHAQWVKLVNASSVPIDLGGYLLGAGNASYGETVGVLAGVVEAGRCSVIGGPDSTPDDGAPVYDQVLDFSPDIPMPVTGAPAVGVGLFAAAAGGAADSTAAVPVDAVVVGTDNPAGLVGPGGAAAIPLADAVATGHSLARQAAETWIVRATPAPGECPTLE